MSVDEHDGVDQLLTARGERYRSWGRTGADDVTDLDRRAGRQGRNRRMVAVAAMVIVLALTMARGFGAPSPQGLRLGGDDAPAPTAAPTTTPEPTSPTGPGPSTTLAPPSSVPAPLAPVPTAATTPTVASSRPTPVPAGGGGDVHTVDWETITYRADVCGSAQPVEGTPFVPNRRVAPGSMDAGIVPGQLLVFGDLTGDGRDEAVVAVDCRTGGSMHWSGVWLYAADASAPGGARPLARVAPSMTRPDGFGIDARYIEGATITVGRLTTTWTTFADTDTCCPSQRTTARQRWNGAALVDDGAPVVSPRGG